MPSNWTIFETLCRIIGGQDPNVLKACLEDKLVPQMIVMAASQDVLPALAVRCYEQQEIASAIGYAENQKLRDALLESTRRNMHIVVQGIKLIRALNNAGIKPLLLKGTAQLLTINRQKPGFRKQADIDLIVKPESLVVAAESLQAEGYGFYQDKQAFKAQPSLLGDTQAAIHASAAHHHLPPLVKSDQIAFVELHKHFLPKRFQHKNPLKPLFDTANEHEIQDARFLVPSTEYQIIHIILGKLVHDGYLARREFPVREAFDYIDLLDTTQGVFDSELVVKHCGTAFSVFSQLVTDMMGYKPTLQPSTPTNIRHRLGMMRMRYNFPAPAKLLDVYARTEHLAYSMLYSPSKLTAYLRR